ncbi:MAG: ABC transporter permease [Ignavibacteriales bacterium]|nr:ABC transporter permease [Ignavibacteriales bacterium]
MNAVTMLARRELVRFVRQRSRMIAVVASPILFWIVIGSGLNKSFQYPGGPEEISYLEYFFPGSVILIVLFASVFSSISVIEDRREGFLQAVLVAPAPRSSVVLGKVFGIAILATVQGALFLALAPLVVPNVTIGSLLLTLIVLAFVSLGLASLGFLIAWSMDSTQGFHAVMNLLLVPMWMLSGALLPMSGATGWVAAIMAWNPLMYGVAAARLGIYGLDPRHEGDLPAFGLAMIVLVAFSLITVLAAIWTVRHRQRG